MDAPAPTEAALLAAWEQGRPRGAPERAVALLAAAHPGRPRAELAALPIGRRDALLLDLRGRLFGPRCRCIASCPACGERLELGLAIAELRAPAPLALPPALTCAGRPFGLRLLDSYDLVAARAAASPGAARLTLLARCLVGLDGAPPPAPGELSPAEVAAVAEWLGAADPQADVALDMQCPVCATTWAAPFAIDEYLWAEIDAWAVRTLREIHQLARAYGWTEANALALSAARRHYYLELLADG